MTCSILFYILNSRNEKKMLPNVAFHELVVITRRQEKVMEFNKMCFPKEENDRKGKKGISG